MYSLDRGHPALACSAILAPGKQPCRPAGFAVSGDYLLTGPPSAGDYLLTGPAWGWTAEAAVIVDARALQDDLAS